METNKGAKKKISPKYYVVQLKQPVHGIDEYICVPWSWIKQRWHSKNDVSVYYPIEDPVVREKRIKRRQRAPKECIAYRSTIKHTADSYEEAQVFLKNIYANLDKDVDTSETNNRVKKQNTKGNKKSIHKAEISIQTDGKFILKLKKIYKESGEKKSKISQPNKSAPATNQARFHVIQFLKSKLLNVDEHVCVPQSWVRQHNENNVALIKYPIEHPSRTELRVKKEEPFLISWKLFGGIVKYSTDSYKDAVFSKKIYNILNKYPDQHLKNINNNGTTEEKQDDTERLETKNSKSPHDQKSVDNIDTNELKETLVVSNNKHQGELGKNIEKETEPTKKIDERACQESDEIESRLTTTIPTYEVPYEVADITRPDSATYDPTNIDKCKYCVIQFLDLPKADIAAYVCIPFKWLIREHSRSSKHCSRDRKVTVSYPVEDPSITEQRVKNNEDFSEQWDLYEAVEKYSTYDYEKAQHYIKFVTDYENKCMNLNSRETARANETVVSTDNRNRTEDAFIEVSSESDEDTTCEMQQLTLSDMNERTNKNEARCTQTTDSTQFEEHFRLIDEYPDEDQVPAINDLSTQEVSVHNPNERVPDQIKPNTPQYYVIQFAESPYKDIDDFICVPASWIKKRRPTDRRVMVSYPIEDHEDTEKRVLNNENVSDKWISYISFVKFEADCYEDAQWYILEKTPVDFDKKGSDRKAIVKRMLEHRRLYPDPDNTYSEPSEYSDDSNNEEDSNEAFEVSSEESLTPQIINN